MRQDYNDIYNEINHVKKATKQKTIEHILKTWIHKFIYNAWNQWKCFIIIQKHNNQNTYLKQMHEETEQNLSLRLTNMQQDIKKQKLLFIVNSWKNQKLRMAWNQCL